MVAKRNVLCIMCDQLRFDYLELLWPPAAADTEYRCAGCARRAVYPRLCPVAGLRAVAHELLHRPLHALARRQLERLPAARRRAHARRPPAANSACARAWSARPTWRPTPRAWHGSASTPTSSTGVLCRNAASSPMSATTACIPTVPSRVPRYDALSPRPGYRRGEPVGGMGGFRRRRGWRIAQRLAAAACRQAGADSGAVSETPYITRRAMAFIDEAARDGAPWCLHLSYIKPHWPYIAPAPYHAIYGRDDVVPPVRSETERVDRIRCIARSWAIASQHVRA